MSVDFPDDKNALLGIQPPSLLPRAFTEWMRRYTEEPERFVREFESVQSFNAGPDDYGHRQASYLLSIVSDLHRADNPEPEITSEEVREALLSFRRSGHDREAVELMQTLGRELGLKQYNSRRYVIRDFTKGTQETRRAMLKACAELRERLQPVFVGHFAEAHPVNGEPRFFRVEVNKDHDVKVVAMDDEDGDL
jgi:hypothetical protein